MVNLVNWLIRFGIVNMKNNIDIISLNTLKIDEMLKFLTFNIYFRLFSYKKNKK